MMQIKENRNIHASVEEIPNWLVFKYHRS